MKTNNYGILVFESYKNDIDVYKIDYTTEEGALKIFELSKDLIIKNFDFIYIMVKCYPSIVEKLNTEYEVKVSNLNKIYKKNL